MANILLLTYHRDTHGVLSLPVQRTAKIVVYIINKFFLSTGLFFFRPFQQYSFRIAAIVNRIYVYHRPRATSVILLM